MEITDAWLAQIGGWAAMKAARSLLAAGAVSDAAREGGLIRGTVGAGKNKHRCGFRIRSRSDVENLCTCPPSRGRGIICEHSLAVCLAVLQGAATPPATAAASPSAAAQKPAATPPGQFTLFFPESWATGEAPPMARTNVLFQWQPGGEAVETKLAAWLAGHGLACGTMPLAVESRDLDSLLRALGGHERTRAGKPSVKPAALHVADTESRLPMTVTENGDAVELRLDRSRFRHLGGPWWLCVPTAAVFPLPSIAAGEVANLLREIATGSARRPLPWLVRHLSELEAALELQLEGPLLGRLQIVPVPCKFILTIDGSPQVVEAQLEAAHSQARWLAGDPASLPADLFPIADSAQPGRFFVPNPAREQAAVRLLENLGFAPLGQGRWRLQGAERVLRFFGSDLPRLERQFTVQQGERWRHITRGWLRVSPKARPAATAETERAPGHDWLSMEISYEAANGFHISRADVLQMIRSGRSGATGPDGRRYVVDAESCEQFEESLRDVDGQLAAGGIRLRADHADYLSSFGREGEDGPALPMQSADEIKRQLGPLAEVLRPYQIDGVRWLEARCRAGRGALLADDMGLGKTLQTIALIRLLAEAPDPSKHQPALVICPKSLVANWQAEFERFAPDLRVSALVGSGRQLNEKAFNENDVLISTYSLLINDLSFYQNHEIKAIALDEASYIRNPDTEAAKAVRQLRGGCRIALSGTPIENGIRDLWSISQFLNPGYLGNRESFKERFEQPISRIGLENGPGRQAASRLRRLSGPFILRRTKQEVLTELPEKIEQIHWCALSDVQIEVYQRVLDEGREEIRQARRRAGSGAARLTMLTILLRLRQICCDLRLAKLPEATLAELSNEQLSGKQAAWTDKLNEAIASNGKVLVFSQFVRFLHLLRNSLERQQTGYCYLDGQTEKRQDEVQTFQSDPNRRVFLISLKAGGYGLNLTAANQVMLMDPWWNPAVESQAIDRAHRMGQNRAVLATRFATRGTVEEKILKLQAAKRSLIDATLNETEPHMSGLSDDELEELISEHSFRIPKLDRL